MKPLPTICFLTGTLNAFAGAERMTAVIANALAERGYPVLILSLWDERSCFTLHPDVVHEALFAQRPSFKRAYLATIGGIRRFVKQQHVDVLIEVDTMLTLFTLPATIGLTVRRIAWEHCHFDQDLGKPARRFARRLAARYNDAVVVLTKRDRQRWEEALAPRCRVEVIANPLPFPFPEVAAERNSKTVLAVGRLVPAKGFDVLLRAWSQVVPTYPDWRLLIVGEGDERHTLESLRAELSLTGSVDMPGIQSKMETVYEKAAIFCLSSHYEGFSLVLIEAMAFGLPILSTNCETGPKELIVDGRSGVMVPTDNPVALANSLTQLIADEYLCTRLANEARKSVRPMTIEPVSERWQAILLETGTRTN